MFLIPLWILIFFTCPETTYLRDRLYDTDVLRDQHLSELVNLEKSVHGTDSAVETTRSNDIERHDPQNIPAKKSFVQSLAIYTGTYTKDNVLKLFAAPFVTLLNPGALYTTITSGLLQAWYVGTAIVQTQLFAAPPYLLNAGQIGDLSVGPLLGGTIGSFLLAFISDPIAKWACNRNKGV
jgi:hypothetical protein